MNNKVFIFYDKVWNQFLVGLITNLSIDPLEFMEITASTNEVFNHSIYHNKDLYQVSSF